MIPHALYDIVPVVGVLVGGAWVVVQLLSDKKQAETNTLIAETNGLIREHIAGDTQKHAALDGHLIATDKRVDRLEDKVFG